jgi:ATP/maltotriose-dependent transcriptional regulator MalT
MGRALLAMNEEEARMVLSARRIEESSGLLALADGWPALIALARLAEQASPPRAAAPEELYSFFAEELYQGASPSLQQALRRLALAPYVTSDIAETLIRDNADSVITDGLELGFLVADHERLELHPLLRSFLASKFRKRRDDPTGKLVAELSQVLIAREEWDDVFDLASRFADDLLLIKLFETSLHQMLEHARIPTLQRWIQSARARKLTASVLILAEAEIAFRRGELPRAEAFACQAARSAEEEHLSSSRALWLAGTSAHLASRDEEALEYFKRAEHAATSDGDARSAVWGQFTASESLDREEDAAALLADFTERSGTSVDELLRIATGHFRLATLCGGIDQTIDRFRGLTHLAEHSRDPLIRSSFLNSSASLLVLAGRYEQAATVSESAIAFIRDASLDFALPFALLNAAASHLGLRRFRTCRTNLVLSDRSTLRSAFLICNTTAIDARLRLATNQASEAALLLEQTYPVAKTQRVTHAEHLAWWSMAEAVAGNAQAATILSRQAESLSQRIEVSALVPWTNALLVSNKNTNRRAAQTAFQITLKTGNIDAFVTAYRAQPHLLELLLVQGQHEERLKSVLCESRDQDLAETVGLSLPTPPEIKGLTLLTKREREVVELVAGGLTNKEIGRTLFITEATVKVHVRKICRKLGVRTRTEAAMRAAELSD